MVITIARQYGSGGRVIGKALAEKLGIAFYDRELIRLAAKESGFSTEYLDRYDEKAANSLLYSLSIGASATLTSEYGLAPEAPANDKLFLLQHNIIRQIAERPCVIVGRCADYVLADRADCVRIFICANDESRAERIAALRHISPAKAGSVIKKADKTRANYYNYYAAGKWGDPVNYDLCINSSTVGIEKAPMVIEQYLHVRGLL